MSEKPFSEMSLQEMCEWHMQYGAPDGSSIRNLLELAESHRKVLREMRRDELAEHEHTFPGYKVKRQALLAVIGRYQVWAKAALKKVGV